MGQNPKALKHAFSKALQKQAHSALLENCILFCTLLCLCPEEGFDKVVYLSLLSLECFLLKSSPNLKAVPISNVGSNTTYTLGLHCLHILGQEAEVFL
jgi:hypothetical protein